MNEIEERQLKILLTCYAEEYQKQGDIFVCPSCKKPVVANRTRATKETVELNCKHCGIQSIDAWKFDSVEVERRMKATLPEHILKKAGG
jgi:predicted RNA-binding Zn-ribbon protein involved in translation (DUF1610 family)